jgi:hypothetical protein
MRYAHSLDSSIRLTWAPNKRDLEDLPIFDYSRTEHAVVHMARYVLTAIGVIPAYRALGHPDNEAWAKSDT